MASLTVPEALYARLAAEAQREGLAVDELLAALLAERVQGSAITQEQNVEVVEGYDPATDPLARFAGIIETATPGWIERHDAVFGETCMIMTNSPFAQRTGSRK